MFLDKVRSVAQSGSAPALSRGQVESSTPTTKNCLNISASVFVEATYGVIISTFDDYFLLLIPLR